MYALRIEPSWLYISYKMCSRYQNLRLKENVKLKTHRFKKISFYLSYQLHGLLELLQEIATQTAIFLALWDESVDPGS